MRKTGIDVIGKLPWGSHFCQFYQTKKDLLDVLVSYFRAGLEQNELCVWVTSDFLNKKEALAALEASIPEFQKYLGSGRIEVIPHTDWYIREGKFELKRVLRQWEKKHEQAISSGFEGMRVSGNPFWIDNKKDWDDFTAYEAEINNVIHKYKILVLCTYSLEKCGSTEILDVVSNHEFALLKRNDKWELIESAEHKRIGYELEQSKAMFKIAVDSSPLAIYLAEGIDQKAEYVNPRFVELFGYTIEEVPTASHWYQLAYPDSEYRKKTVDEWKRRVARAHETGKPIKPMEAVAICKDGSKKTILWSFISVGKRNISYGLDLTERRKSEEEKNNFIALMSHELRNPLTPILFGSQLIKERIKNNAEIDSLIVESIETIEKQSENLARLLDDLLDISRISMGKINLDKKVINSNEHLESAVKSTRYLFDSQKHHLTVDLPSDPVFLEADGVRIEQIIVNLLNNAAKYTRPGGQVWLRARRRNDEIEIVIGDNGIGIEKDKIGTIFKLFTQADMPFTSTQGEFGIGLKLTKDLVAMHGGTITLKSEGRNQGSEFIVRLPALPSEYLSDSMPNQPKNNAKKQLNILLVDDDKSITSLLEKALAMYGHTVSVCNDGFSAIEMAQKMRSEVAIIDIGMPGLSGHEVARELQKIKRENGDRITLIALTGYGHPEDKEKTKKAGFDLHLVKPIDITTLEKVLDSFQRKK